MVKHVRGTALILVLLLSSLVAILGIATIKSSVWMQDMQQAVFEQEKQFRFAQGALDCAIARGVREFDQIRKRNKILTGTIIYKDGSATLKIEPLADALAVSCGALGSNHRVALSARLAKDENGKVHVLEFSKTNL